MNIAFAIRNRMLRYGKRYRQYFFNGSSLSSTTQQQWSIRRLFFLTIFAICCCLFILWLTTMNGTDYDDNNIHIKSEHIINHGKQELKNGTSLTINNDQHESLGMIYNESDRKHKESGFLKHAFNTLVSQRIGSIRNIPDTRHQLCQNQTYNLYMNQTTSTSIDASIIICFYNEDWPTLQRTIFTILERSPTELLKEIILVDDFSDDYMQQQIIRFRRYLESSQPSGMNLKYLEKVRFHRVPERSGLIRARLYGAQFARGQTLLFLDSHCEVNQQWLEPLLATIVRNRSTIAIPIIDLIDPDTFRYSSSPLVKGGFNWGLHFKWDSVPAEMLKSPEDFIKPIPTPTMAGGLFAIDREYFQSIGSYDRGMDIWGGENIEISFRVWMCGGQLLIVPCSRVGHVFRHRRPYGSLDGKDTLAHNSLRVAHVWMDDYKKYYLQSRSDLTTMDYGNVDERIELRRQLNCSSFETYLHRIYPELLTPDQRSRQVAEDKSVKLLQRFNRKPKKVIDTFSIQLYNTNLCLSSDTELTYKSAKLLMKECSVGQRRQQWKMTEIGDIRLGPRTCLDCSQRRSDLVHMGKCHEMGGTQQWKTDGKNQTNLENIGSGLCLAVRSDDSLAELESRQSIRKDAIMEEDVETPLEIVMSYCNQDELKHNSANSYIFTKWNLI